VRRPRFRLERKALPAGSQSNNSIESSSRAAAGRSGFAFGEHEMRVLMNFILAACCSLVLIRPAAAQEGQLEGRIFQLADAYQDGYLKLATVSAYSVYSTTGIIFGDFVNGVIDGGTAINAMEQIALLQSVCYTTIVEVEELTPESDSAGLAEIRAIRNLLEKENGLLSALLDLFSEGGEAEVEAVQIQLGLVEQALDDYTNPPTE